MNPREWVPEGTIAAKTSTPSEERLAPEARTLDQAEGRSEPFFARLQQPSSQKLAASIADDIERYIVEHGWPVGKIIFLESELMARYNASRAIVREAVRLLEQHTTARMRKGRGGGLVVTRPEAGPVTNVVAMFLEYGRVTPLQLFEARVTLELTAVELATERLTEDGISRLRQAIAMEQSVPREELWQHTHDIHVLIAEAANNPTFPLFVTVLAKLVDARVAHFSEALAPTVYHAHSAIVEAIISGDAAIARHRMRRHLEGITPYLGASSSST